MGDKNIKSSGEKRHVKCRDSEIRMVSELFLKTTRKQYT